MASRTSFDIGLFDGPGEMRALCREFDWSATPLGPVESWSHALRTTVSTLLASRHPMFLFWGPEGVQFYNDAYRPSLAGGGRHPRALGMRGCDFWVEIWDIIGPQIATVMGGGDATWHEDQLVPIERNGRIEEVYWTYSYSPVRDDDGSVAACLVVCQETTERVLAARRLHTLHRLAALPQLADFESTVEAACQILASDDADVRFCHCTLGTDGNGDGDGKAPVAVAPLEHAPTGRTFGTLTVGLSEQLPFDANYEDFVRTAARDIAGQLLQVESAAEHARLTRALRLERERLAFVFEHTPAYLAILRGPEHAFELANDAYYQLIGQREIIGKRLLDALPEIRGQGFDELLDAVLRTGEPYIGQEVPALLARTPGAPPEERFVDMAYLPIIEADGSRSGIVVHGTDVTEHVHARREVERLLSASERAFGALAESEERYRLAAETARLGTWTWDVVADRVTFDSRVADIFGLDGDGATSVAIISTRVHPEDQDLVNTALAAALDPAGPGRYEAEYRVVRPDGTEREVVTAGRAFFIGGAGEHRPSHVIGTVLDVTVERTTRREQERLLRESERARAALIASEARFRTVQDASPDASLLARAIRNESGEIVDFLLTYANAASQRILVGSDERVVNRTMRDAFAESVTAGRLETYSRVVETGVPWQADVEYSRGDVRRGLRVTAVKVGDAIHISAVDLSERLRVAAERERLLTIAENARAEAERARIAAEEANRAKAEFLATMSHELRTPLNAIGGYAELIELGIHGPVTEPQREALARIQASQRHLLGLINDVLNYTRVEAGAVRYDIERAPVMEALIACEALTAPQMRAKQLTFHQAHADPSLAVTADREKLRQILLNLLSNATKFTDAGGTIEARVMEAGAVVTIEVEDTGRGIAPDQMERIFEPFVQVDARFTRTEQGVGLGLAISRDLARGMGGDLVAASKVGVGSTFRLSLPRG
ncbi:MAG TPA: PAS domain-containing protein [Gemmatimonadaceae bacterium]|nr:PAS domain-containing protein [Gemmatimonadaceae bacterium]